MRRRKPPTEDLDLPASRDDEIDRFVKTTLALPQAEFLEALKREVMGMYGFNYNEAEDVVMEAKRDLSV